MPTFDGTGRLIRRKNTNFFDKVFVSTVDFADCFVKWDFNSHGFSLMVESFNINDIIEYSFNGTDAHGDLSPSLPSGAIIFDNRSQNAIWFRLKTAGDPVLVRIEAWRNDA